jgi:hypothetical protein
LVVIVGSGLLSLFYTYVRRDAFVAVLSNTIALAAAVNFAAGLLSYTTQFWGASIPLRDASFAEFDSVLGFDWVGWFSWLNARPLLATILRAAYVSLPFQILFLSIAQFVFSWELRVQRLFLATLLAGIITLAVAAVLPALGAYPHFERPPRPCQGEDFPGGDKCAGRRFSEFERIETDNPHRRLSRNHHLSELSYRAGDLVRLGGVAELRDAMGRDFGQWSIDYRDARIWRALRGGRHRRSRGRVRRNMGRQLH